MTSDTIEGMLPPEIFDGIEKSIDNVKLVGKKKVKVTRPAIDWSKIKENVEQLKLKCTDFSKKFKEAESIEEKNELALQAKKIREEWLKIRAMIHGEK
jgi:hypothetical protein